MADGGAPQQGLRIGLLGGFDVRVHGRAVPPETWRRRKPAALLKLLALAPRYRLHREQLMDVLWPDLDASAAGANLRKALHQARRALGPEPPTLIASDGEWLSLPPDRVTVDVDDFRTAVLRARRSADPALYATAIDIYDDGLLPEDRYEEWALAPRDELQADFAGLLSELAALLEARGDLDDAAATLRRLVSADPANEDAHARLIRTYALSGRRTEALRQYEQLRNALAEIGGDPSVGTQRLFEDVRAKRAAEPELSTELWERVGDLRILAGDAAGATKAFECARSATAAPDGADAGRLQRKTAAALLMQHEPERAESHLALAEQLLTDPAERARLACLRANQLWEQGELDRARASAEEALALASTHGTADDIAAAHEALAVVSHLSGDWRAGLHAELGRLAGDSDRSVDRVYDIHHCIGQYHLYGDALSDDVEEYARRTLALAEDAGAVRGQAFAWCLLGEALLLQARWDEAAGCLERSCELHASLGTRSGALPWQRLGELAVCCGDTAAAQPYLRRASAIATVSPMANHLWGRIHATAAFASLEQDDPESAARSVHAAAAAAERYGDCPTCSALLNPIAAQAFAALGNREGARIHAENAERVAEMFESSAWGAMAASAAGSVAAADRDDDRAKAAYAQAAVLYERARQPYWRQRAAAAAV